MLEYFIELDFKLLQLRRCAAGDHMDSFAGWLQSAGYRRRPAQLLLRGAAHFSEWASTRAVPVDQFDQRVLDSFAGHIATCACTHSFHGRDRYHWAGAKRLVEHLRNRGILPPAESQFEPLPVLVDRFSAWMRSHRGATESTIRQYTSITKEFLAALGEDTTRYDAALVRNFVLAKSSRSGRSCAKGVANASRMFLRFLATYGLLFS